MSVTICVACGNRMRLIEMGEAAITTSGIYSADRLGCGCGAEILKLAAHPMKTELSEVLALESTIRANGGRVHYCGCGSSGKAA